MASIIVTIISVVGSFVVVYLTAVKELFTQKHQICREQLDNFYIPFYQFYCRGLLFYNNLSQLGLESRSNLLDLLTSNIYLMEPKSQALYTSFYLAFLNMLEAEDGNKDYPLDKCSEELDIVFMRLTNAVFTEYKGILKKCNLPAPSIPQR
nr:MAG TPA: hypothetical protein [Caudoviricetes sp.]